VHVCIVSVSAQEQNVASKRGRESFFATGYSRLCNTVAANRASLTAYVTETALLRGHSGLVRPYQAKFSILASLWASLLAQYGQGAIQRRLRDRTKPSLD